MENVIAANATLRARQLDSHRSSRTLLWVGRVVGGLIVAFLLADALAKLLALPAVVEATQRLGYSVGVIRPLGVVLALAALLHIIPRTQFLGALLLTAYLGGATATHVHSGTPFWFAVGMGVILWVTYFLRSPHLRAFLLSAKDQPGTAK